jgi:hypothetical protein
MSDESKSSPILIVAAWLLVAIPLSWGVFKSGQNAAKLFTAPAPAAAAPAK